MAAGTCVHVYAGAAAPVCVETDAILNGDKQKVVHVEFLASATNPEMMGYP